MERNQRRRTRLPVTLVIVATLASTVLGAMLVAFGPGQAGAASASKAQLDRELTHARSDLGLPDSMLAATSQREHRAASGSGSLFYNYRDATTQYQQLYRQLVGIEQGAQPILQQQAQADLQAFGKLLDQRRADGYADVSAYQTRLDAAQQAYAQARTAGDYARVSETAATQAHALQAMGETHDRLQQMQSVINSLHHIGVSTAVAQQFYDADMQAFKTAKSAADFEALARAVDLHFSQLVADQSAAEPYVAAALLSQFRTHIDQLKQYGDTSAAATFQAQYDQVASKVAAAKTPVDYQPLVTTLTQQDDATALPIAKAKANTDFATLQQLVDSVRNKTVINPYDHRAYPLAYEYTSRYVGIGDASDNLNAAKTAAQYQSADFEITSLTACLQAMIDNLSDSTPHDQVHQTDLRLLQYFNVTSGRAVVISLREQTARFYENGQLVYWSYVTTGRPELPSVPGWHVAQSRLSPTTFTSPDPVGSPNYYQPTHINYAVAYNAGGYFLHDAWWRHQFGPNTNLPHRDPAAFNGGSHGCVNFPLSNMKWAYSFTVKETPIILY